MQRGLKVLIVGAGRFAQNYIDVLDALNRRFDGTKDNPAIASLVLTRTRSGAAFDLVDRLTASGRYTFACMQAEQVNHAGQLNEVLLRHRPDLICITARDRVAGDSIHAAYAPLAIDYGPVLCEKPFAVAHGDGAALEILKKLAAHPSSGWFGMHLPMAVVRQAMLADDWFGKLLKCARVIEFLWQKEGSGFDLASDLGLHPWSLAPTQERLVIEAVDRRPERFCLDFRWRPLGASDLRTGRIVLETGGTFRGMGVDDLSFSFAFRAGKLLVQRHKIRWRRLINDHGARAGAAKTLLVVDNPLEQQLRAVLKHKPIVDIQRTFDAQCFLEMINGYKPIDKR